MELNQDGKSTRIVVVHACGHQFQWSNRFIDPSNTERLKAYQRYLSTMICPDCYACHGSGPTGRPS